ncbi:RNA helicase SDE3 [Pyrus ussuriensis x Pyrus communis]|uniref:RNA helicase SDE3 n=1 Tax=Pyrus ussuriensis x Pyrus communis TaxID=2448454 RepID=A0A5N5HBD8_9ROSA|nr:RNA helicase SDE3 [Pyrus ussuriensis x Pyrus communis]
MGSGKVKDILIYFRLQLNGTCSLKALNQEITFPRLYLMPTSYIRKYFCKIFSIHMFLTDRMSIFCDLLRCLLCCDDEHDNAYHSLSQFPAQTASNKRDYYYETSNRNTSQPFTSFTPAASPLKPPSTQYNHAPQASSRPNSSSPKPPTSSPKPSSSSCTPTASSKPSSSSSFTSSPPILLSSSSTFHTKTSNNVSSSKPPQASSGPNSPSPKPPTSSPKPSSSSCTPTASSKPSSSSSFTSSSPNPPTYVWVEKDSLPIFAIPDNIKDLIKNDIAPKVLNQPLSPVTYKDYFAALLYAEEFFYEVRPYISRHDFYVHHYSTRKYDVSFSFNRVCLKRAHQAVQNASDALFRNFLFPESVLLRHILSIRGSPPYLLAGQLCVEKSGFRLSRTGVVISEAVYQLCQTSHGNRILICAPSNRCCDQLMRSLLKWIPESDMFRANAAFREKEEVPEDILPSCLYEETCFSCPPTEELCEFRVISSTFMSSFRLHDKGLTAGHFSHIFLVDASSAIEPETLVALTSFGDKNTTVIVTGEAGDRSRWVRADIARKKGLKISFFERLSNLSPMSITRLEH